jgi:hypothetical protein
LLLDPKLATRLTERLARLTEAGRVLSTANEKAIRAAIDALQAVLSKIAGGDSAESAQIEAADAALVEAEAILAQDDSYEGRRMRVQKALTDRHRTLRMAAWAAGMALDPEYGCYPWIRDLYDDAVVYEQDSQLYRSDYAVDADGIVTLGEPVKVRVSYVPADEPAAATESDPPAAPGATTASEAAEVLVTSELVPLVEKAVRKDGTVPIKIIQPGWGSSGYYSAEMLERDGPRVFTKGLHMYIDHPTEAEEEARPERSVRDIAGVLETTAHWDAKGPAGPGLYADAKVMPAFAEHLDALAPHIGTSIRSLGTVADGEAEGRSGKLITSLVAAKSVDFVTHAGAGGAVLSLMESARGRRTSATPPGGTEVPEISEQEAKTLREAMSGLERQLEESKALIARQNEAILLRDARDLITSVLAESEMPDLTRKRLLDELVKRPVIKEGQLDREATTLAVREAVKAELTYLAQATGGTGQIRGMGSGGGVSPQWQEQSEKKLAGGLARLGLSEAAATTAARGR